MNEEYHSLLSNDTWDLVPLPKGQKLVVKFAENISAYKPSSADVPPLSIPSTFENISSLDDDSKDENPPPPSRDLPSAPQLPKWVCATWNAAGALVGDPTNQ